MSDAVHVDDEGKVSIDALVTIVPPERITLGMHRQFMQERDKYLERNAKTKLYITAEMADYYAGLVFLREYPYYKVSGPPEFMRQLALDESEYDKLDGDVVSVILYSVSYPVKGSVNDFLRDKPKWTVQVLKNGSRGTS